jgi:hypothetical protein
LIPGIDVENEEILRKDKSNKLIVFYIIRKRRKKINFID